MERIYLSKITALLILLVGVVGFLIGAYARPFAAMDLKQNGAFKSTDSSCGRFSLVISPLVKTEKFLLDTQTGKIWQVVKSDDLPDKTVGGYRIAIMDDLDLHHPMDNKSKLNLRVANDRTLKDRTANDRMLKDKTLKEKALTEKTPNDDATIEVITKGRISQEKVPREMTSNEKVVKGKAVRKNTVSVNAPNETNL